MLPSSPSSTAGTSYLENAMDCLLTDEQRMLKEMVGNFGRDKVKPIAGEIDKTEQFPAELVKELSELGLMGIPFPEECGGSGMDSVSYMIAVEGISRYCASTGVIISSHTSLCVDPIYQFGTDEQRAKYMPDLCSGRKLGCMALTEPQAGSDPGAIKTTAKLEGDTWVLNGTKQFISNASQADVAIIFALTEPEARTRGMSAFIVEKDAPGFSIGTHEEKLGIHGCPTSEVILEDCTIPKENLLGELNKGFKLAMVTLDGGRIGIAAQALGIARASIEDAIEYAKERVQFGHPIAEFQGIKWYLADMATECEAAWLLTYRAALMKDLKLRYSKEAAMAKLKASEVAEFCASKAIQIHGGYGYTREFDVERYFRDSKITQIYEGTSEIQREVIAANILK